MSSIASPFHPTNPLRVDFINPFLQAASGVLTAEIGEAPERGPLCLHPSAYTSLDVTALIGVTGQVSGIVLFGLTEATACAIAGRILGQPFTTFDDLAQSGIGELANVIVGRATTLLAAAGYSSTIAPPALIIDHQRLVIPLQTSLGHLELQVALRAH
jgi:chemotaxis protein CheX